MRNILTELQWHHKEHHSMGHMQTYQVFPKIPEPLSFLETLARNYWWSWHLDAVELFRRIDQKLWEQSKQNPVFFFALLPQSRLEELATDESFIAHQNNVRELFARQVTAVKTPAEQKNRIAYFSMEFGIHESLPLFAGGLGVLAGDHLKAASDMQLPLIGIGLFYRQGYFHQFLDLNGWQQEEYPEINMFNIPLNKVLDTEGKQLHVSVEGPNGTILAVIWRIDVGSVPLFLLDTNIRENTPKNRNITSRLYNADPESKLAQEILLGIGGMRALTAMNIEPSVCHLNEGHCAFAAVEWLARLMETQRIDRLTAWEIVSRSTVFTTHTPVSAGIDEFPADRVRPYLEPLTHRLASDVDEILSWGQCGNMGPEKPLSMFVLALRLSQYRNGVSRLHGRVARRLWSYVWPGVPEDEIPIDHVTNGIHYPSWLSVENARLFDRFIGPAWQNTIWQTDTHDQLDKIHDEELWSSHEMSRSRLVRFSRKLLVNQHERRNSPKKTIDRVSSALGHDILTIGFARRFATYKRAYLLLMNPERLEKLIISEKYPVQFIFAGKAHPRDNEGRGLVQQIFEFANRPAVRGRFVFLEDYDINIARHLVQGTDVWLNTPKRPYEACGTSGIKAAANGGLNVSIMDGWWCEGYQPENGWAIGGGEEYDDPEYQDAIESQALFNVLENEVIPCFYERTAGGIPSRWVNMMKSSMKIAMQDFIAQRMVGKYLDNYYKTAIMEYHQLTADDASEAKRLCALKAELLLKWPEIKVGKPIKDVGSPFRVGDLFAIHVEIYLGSLSPESVNVELYHGKQKNLDTIVDGRTELMHIVEDRGDGNYLYGCNVNCIETGRYGFSARGMPKDPSIRYTPLLITWA